MLAIRRFIASGPHNSRREYDALPLSDLGPAHSTSPPPSIDRPPHKQALTARKVVLTILITTLAFTAVITAFSLFDVDPNSDRTQVNAAEPASALRLTGAGSFYRDAYPIRNMIKYWEVAEREVKERALDTCDGQLSQELIDAYARSAIDYCHPPSPSASSTSITCAPVHHDEFSRWWPHPLSPCVSTHLRPMPDTYTSYQAESCVLTEEGRQLKAEMLDGDQKDQKFVGTDIQAGDAGDCESLMNRTIIEIPRQDQWNPFHVAEDLITTVVSVLIAARLRPDLVDTKVQLVFADQYGMDGNHFTALWDRIGAWAPRRLVLDPWRKGECLGNTIHSVNAGSSLLSAVQVNRHYACTSTITWGASHYYRHLVGLEPRAPSTTTQPPINILWLSRAKYDAWSQNHDEWTTWKEWRHVDNEDELLNRFRSGLTDFCAEQGQGCIFQDGQDGLADWHVGSEKNQSRIIRFHTIDPSVHAIENQLYLVGHSTVLVSPHSGALGLGLFLPPGHGHIIELQVPATVGWHHYDILATEMGMRYDMIPVRRTVDVEKVWSKVKQAVEQAIEV